MREVKPIRHVRIPPRPVGICRVCKRRGIETRYETHGRCDICDAIAEGKHHHSHTITIVVGKRHEQHTEVLRTKHTIRTEGFKPWD